MEKVVKDVCIRKIRDVLSRSHFTNFFAHAVSQSRPTDPNYAPGYKIKFNDAYPFLLISQKSLDVLNEQLKEPVSINRFRPKYLLFLIQSFRERNESIYSDYIY